jgi:hypothetical protein
LSLAFSVSTPPYPAEAAAFSATNGSVKKHHLITQVVEASRCISHNFKIGVPQILQKTATTKARVKNEHIVFSIVEAYSRTEHIEKHPTHAWMDKRTYTYQLLGNLKIAIEGYYEGRKSWSDGKTQRLEDKLPQVIEGFIAAAEAMKRRTEELRAQQRWNKLNL